MPFLSLDGVSKSFGRTAAVLDLSLEVERGQCVALLGPSGCCKTTTLNVIAGFLEPDAGAIVIDGRRVNGVPPRHRNTGMVFQNYALFPHLDVFENIAFGLKMRRAPALAIARRVEWVLDLIQLTGYERRRVRQLSGGQQQRVALARALVIEPAVLLLDEPLSNLDAKLRQTMRLELRQIQRRVGITTIIVTHDQEEALTLADRIAVMRGGRLVQVGCPADVYERPADLFVAGFVGHASVLRGVVEGAAPSGLSVRIQEGFRVRTQSTRPVAVGEAVAVVIRPERVRLAYAATSAANVLEGRIESLSYLGSTALCRLRVGAAVLTAALDPREVQGRGLCDGANALVQFDAEDTLVIAHPEEVPR